MFGKNEVRKQRANDDGRYLQVKEVFLTVQGEGPFAGRVAVFVRLSGCNLRCHYCDTDFEGGDHVSLDTLWNMIEAARNVADIPTSLIVLTGGEPMRQNIVPFLEMMTIHKSMDVQIETAGTLWLQGMDTIAGPIDHAGMRVHIVCSPKTAVINEGVLAYCRHYKYIVALDDADPGDGLPCRSTQRAESDGMIYRPSVAWPWQERRVQGKGVTVWVQPRFDYVRPVHVFPVDAKLEQQVTAALPDHEANKANTEHAARIALQYNYRVSLQTHRYLNLP